MRGESIYELRHGAREGYKTPQEKMLCDKVLQELQQRQLELQTGEENYDSLDALVLDHVRAGSYLLEKYNGDAQRVARLLVDAIEGDGGFVKTKEDKQSPTGAESEPPHAISA